MKPQIYKPDDSGRLVLIYGETKVGKTTTLLKTAPLPIDYIRIEKRSLRPSVEAAARPELLEPGMLNIWDYTNFDEFHELLASEKDPFSKGSTIIFDSLSALMGVEMMLELAGEAFKKRMEDDKKARKTTYKQMVNRIKMSEEAYGGLGGNMILSTKHFQRISTLGHLVVCTAQTQERPKWNRNITVGPLMAGKMYGDNCKGFFDYIGFLQHNVVEKAGKKKVITYPPLVSYESPDESFLCAWTGKKDKPMVNIPFNVADLVK